MTLADVLFLLMVLALPVLLIADFVRFSREVAEVRDDIRVSLEEARAEERAMRQRAEEAERRLAEFRATEEAP